MCADPNIAMLCTEPMPCTAPMPSLHCADAPHRRHALCGACRALLAWRVPMHALRRCMPCTGAMPCADALCCTDACHAPHRRRCRLRPVGTFATEADFRAASEVDFEAARLVVRNCFCGPPCRRYVRPRALRPWGMGATHRVGESPARAGPPLCQHTLGDGSVPLMSTTLDPATRARPLWESVDGGFGAQRGR